MLKSGFEATGRVLAVAASTLVAVGGFVLSPLWVEDATVLFHRANYTDLSILFYYQGYISFLPQAIASLLASWPPYLQAAGYAFAACLIWSLMLIVFLRAAPVTFIPFAGLAYFFTFDALYVFNLTYSLWPALVFIGLIGVLCRIEQRPVRWWEATGVLLLSMSSPLSLFMALPFLPVVFAHRTSAPSWIALIACLLSYPLLTEPGAGAAFDILARIGHRLAGIATHPAVLFSVSGDRLPISPPRLFRLASLLLCLGFAALSILPAFRRRYGALLPFVLASLLVLLVGLSRGTGAEEIGTRYMFPIIFAAMLIASFMFADIAGRALPNRVRLTVYSLLLIAGIGLGIREQPDLDGSLRQFHAFRTATEHDAPVFLGRRGPFTENDWTLAVGNFSFTEEDCRPDRSKADFRFQIYCGPGEILHPLP